MKPATPFDVPQREIGRLAGPRAGATLVAVGGIHGNEPAGLEAAGRVLSTLAAHEGQLRGDFVVFAGNVQALRSGVRFLRRDLNRGWNEQRVRQLRASDDALVDEDREQDELLQAIEAVGARARGPLHLADLHTSSAPGVPFVLFGASPAQRAFVQAFPIPVISGIVEHVQGVLSEFISARGWVTFTVEGGQHQAPAARDSLEAALWLTLERAGMLDDVLADPAAGAVRSAVDAAATTLDALRGELPRSVHVTSRHAITPSDAFVMEPGFRNVDRVKKQQLLARDRRGEIRASDDGVVVLPLYQQQGDDGFFWGHEVR